MKDMKEKFKNNNVLIELNILMFCLNYVSTLKNVEVVKLQRSGIILLIKKFVRRRTYAVNISHQLLNTVKK